MPLKDGTMNQLVWSVPILPVMGCKSTQVWWVCKPTVSLHDEKNDGEEALGVPVNVLFLDIPSYDFSFLEMLWLALGVGMVVSTLLSKGALLVERMLDIYACMCRLTVASEFGVYFVTWFTVNSGQDWRKYFFIALHQVGIIGENKAPW